MRWSPYRTPFQFCHWFAFYKSSSVEMFWKLITQLTNSIPFPPVCLFDQASVQSRHPMACQTRKNVNGQVDPINPKYTLLRLLWFSLVGLHGLHLTRDGSTWPLQRKTRWCTLGYEAQNFQLKNSFFAYRNTPASSEKLPPWLFFSLKLNPLNVNWPRSLLIFDTW